MWWRTAFGSLITLRSPSPPHVLFPSTMAILRTLIKLVFLRLLSLEKFVCRLSLRTAQFLWSYFRMVVSFSLSLSLSFPILTRIFTEQLETTELPVVLPGEAEVCEAVYGGWCQLCSVSPDEWDDLFCPVVQMKCLEVFDLPLRASLDCLSLEEVSFSLSPFSFFALDS